MALTRKQELYFDELLEQVDRGQVVTVKETARKLHIARQTVSRWHADQTFRAAASKILRESNNDLWDHLVDRAVARKAIQGSAKHAELNLRRRTLHADHLTISSPRSRASIVGSLHRRSHA